MKQFLDFIPLVIFFIVYKLTDIYLATTALIVASIIALLVCWITTGKTDKMQIITCVAVLIFGGLTIALRDDTFIKWKVSIVYIVFALSLLISRLFFDKNLIKNMLGKELKLPNLVWDKINIAWVVFFMICALLNSYIAFNFSQATWVNFKVFGLLVMTIVFAIATGLYIYRLVLKSKKLSE